MSNSTYAFIDENSVCVGVTEYQEAVTSDANMVLLESLDTSIIGQRWTGAVWEVVPLTAVTAREWRDGELYSTDWIVPVTDHPDREDYLLYRQALRDWPSTPSFPDTKPTI